MSVKKSNTGRGSVGQKINYGGGKKGGKPAPPKGSKTGGKGHK